jgi:cob(I)alamin adenosyltransferase
MKIYTKRGDQGLTTLYREKEVPKNDYRINLIGLLDELNSHIGFSLSLIWEDNGRAVPQESPHWHVLSDVQKHIFELGALLAGAPLETQWIQSKILKMEEDIDAADSRNRPLTHFILPGGTPAASALHLARTVCRRTEREFVDTTTRIFGISREYWPNDMSGIIQYLNRLSDYLFVVARNENGLEEIIWIKE